MNENEKLAQDKKLFPFLYQENPNEGILRKFDNVDSKPDTYLQHLKDQEKRNPSIVTESASDDPTFGVTKKVMPNDNCPCKSGEKFKKCHGPSKSIRRKFNQTVRTHNIKKKQKKPSTVRS